MFTNHCLVIFITTLLILADVYNKYINTKGTTNPTVLATNGNQCRGIISINEKKPVITSHVAIIITVE